MRILVAHNPYGQPSGEEVALEGLSALLRSRDHEVEVLLGDPMTPDTGLGTTAVAFMAALYNPAARRRMARALDRLRPDVVQVQNLYPFLSPSVLAACRERRIPIVMRCPNYRLFCPAATHLSHGELCERCLGRGRELWCVLRNCERSATKSIGYALRNASARLLGSIVPRVSQFVVLTEFQRTKFLERGIEERKLSVVPNIAPGLLANHATGGGECVSFIGRVSPEKGIGDFVEAARALGDLPFEVAGAERAGPELGPIPDNLRFRGYLTGAEFEAFVRRTRILVFPSRWWEGFPNVLTEAMIAGRPVVAAALGAVPEIVEDGRTGLLYRAGDVNELVARVRELWTDPGRCRRLGAAGRARAQASYSEARVYEALLEAYARAGRVAAS